MSLSERIQDDLKSALRAGDAVTKDTLRMVIAAIKNRRIELGEPLDEAAETEVLMKAVKSREDSVAQYTAAKREDLAARERAEIEVIRRYLPEQLSPEAVRELVEATIRSLAVTSKKDLGRVMKAILAEHRGKVDGKAVQSIANELLA